MPASVVQKRGGKVAPGFIVPRRDNDAERSYQSPSIRPTFPNEMADMFRRGRGRWFWPRAGERRVSQTSPPIGRDDIDVRNSLSGVTIAASRGRLYLL